MFVASYLEKPTRALQYDKLIIGAWLVALPFVVALGTYNNLFLNIMIDINYWLALLCILYVNLAADVARLLLVRLLFFVVPALLIAEQCTYGLLLAPYLQGANMLQQTVPFTFGKTHTPATIQLDAPTARFMSDLTQTMHQSGFRAGMPIVAIYDMPGLVYMLGGVSPGDPWLFGQLDLRNCNSLAKTRMDLTKAFLLTNEKPGAELLACLAGHGVRFPQDFVRVRQLLSPYSPNLYNWRNYQDTLTVYAPRLVVGGDR